ncbi:hypothetical protein EC973_008171 [Apophysomyces ossiformis]|uniref:Vacuolar protein-sorting-associated protein 36 n=1 Tax=Apophysomyces ossiformis TaxID=679940 RepID=A0A8H7BNP6_9FUNG|nr:hypothetical protein EC973_008171 [Apophysomyces ossiformis]
MRYFQKTQLSSSKRPELLPNESLLLQQGNVGLYEGKQKLENYQDGVCYLTSHRLIYVDYTKPTEYSTEISLKLVKDIDSYGGFLRSSPKIILHLDIDLAANTNTPSPPTGTWACPICFYANQASLTKCQLCGVPNTDAEIIIHKPVVSDTDGNESTCGICTFINHPSMIQCEMCGADLAKRTHSSSEPTSPGWVQVNSDVEVRIAFRRAIQDRIEKTTLETNETMADAFQDLDRLMAKATEMVKLAESISNKMTKENSENDGDMSKLRGYLLNLGIASPVTRGSAGSIYHQELARELAEFLDKFLDKEASMKSLTDVYCIFNRARGVALVSPEDLYKASLQFEVLNLPFRLRQFESGLLVIQSLQMNDDRTATRVLRHVKQHGGHITALQLAELEQWALAVAAEQLKMAEEKGLLCRDEGPAGLTFYENLFLHS